MAWGVAAASNADQAAGYRYTPSLWQLEASDTHVFAAPRDGRLWFEHAIRSQLDLSRPDRVQLVFGRRISRQTPGLFRTRVISQGVDPPIELRYRRSTAKAYFKLGRALWVETTIKDTHDLGLRRGLVDLALVRAKAERRAAAARIGVGSAPSANAIASLTTSLRDTRLMSVDLSELAR